MKTLVALCALIAFACHDLTPQQQKAADVFECRVEALRPLVEPAFDAAELARQTIAGTADPLLVMARLGATREAINAAADAWNACEPPKAKPPVAAGVKMM